MNNSDKNIKINSNSLYHDVITSFYIFHPTNYSHRRHILNFTTPLLSLSLHLHNLFHVFILFANTRETNTRKKLLLYDSTRKFVVIHGKLKEMAKDKFATVDKKFAQFTFSTTMSSPPKGIRAKKIYFWDNFFDEKLVEKFCFLLRWLLSEKKSLPVKFKVLLSEKKNKRILRSKTKLIIATQ